MKGDIAFALLCWWNWDSNPPYLFPSFHIPLFQRLEVDILIEEKQEIQIKGFTRCLSWREGISCTSSTWLINMWCSSLSKSLCNACCISVYDQMLILIKLGFCIILIIIALHMVKLVWERLKLILEVSWIEEQYKG